MREEERRIDRSELAISLLTELRANKAAIEGRVSHLSALIEKEQNGGSQIDIDELSELYKANIQKLGALEGTTLANVVRAYKFVQTLPVSIRLKKQLPIIPVADFKMLECSPKDPSLRSIIEGQKECAGFIEAAIGQLEAIK